MAKPAEIKLDKNGKPKKVKREKIRYGQAPEQTLPLGPMTASTGTDRGAGSAQAAGSGATLAPGTTTDENPLTVGEDANAADPMAPKAAPATEDALCGSGGGGEGQEGEGEEGQGDR